MYAHQRRSAFSLIELVIVIVIIGIIGAIAIPRMSRGASGASDNALKANLSVLRSAIDLFHTEHGGVYPSYMNLTNALTQYSDEAGTSFKPAKDTASGHIYGPYLRAVPPLPVGATADKGKMTFADGAYTAGNGWIYYSATGEVKPNIAAGTTDDKGVLYSNY
jgi:prepilin-type N-terminal cleavage/methylation domain-containing protein